MKKLIAILGFFLLMSTVYAKQFCVRIDCYKIDEYSWKKSEVHINIEDEINKYLDKGYKLIAITPEISTSGYGSVTVRYYCIFDDGVN